MGWLTAALVLIRELKRNREAGQRKRESEAAQRGGTARRANTATRAARETGARRAEVQQPSSKQACGPAYHEHRHRATAPEWMHGTASWTAGRPSPRRYRLNRCSRHGLAGIRALSARIPAMMTYRRGASKQARGGLLAARLSNKSCEYEDCSSCSIAHLMSARVGTAGTLR